MVLDLTRVLSGPFCTMMLADMGARVIKVERPGDGDETRAWGPPFVAGESAYFLGTNRNKESIALDFKRPEGRRIIERLSNRPMSSSRTSTGDTCAPRTRLRIAEGHSAEVDLRVDLRIRPNRPAPARAWL